MYGKLWIKRKTLCFHIPIKVDRTGDCYVICEKRCKCRAVEQMSEIKAQRTEDAKVEKRKEYGLREDT